MSETDPRVRRETWIEASPERVFEAWADPEQIAGWYVERQDGDPRTDEQIVWFVTREDLDGDGEPLAVEAIAEWAGEAPERVLSSTSHGGVMTFSGTPGVFAFMGVGGVVVWASVWGNCDLEPVRRKAEELVERLAARVARA